MSNEEMALAIQNGESSDYTDLWERNRPLLLKLANCFFARNKELLARYGLTLDDLQQVAFLALVLAVKAYQPEKGYSLTSYFDISFKRELAAAFCGGERKSKTDALNMSGDLDEPVTDDSNTTFGELLPDENAELAFDAVDQADYDRQTAAALWECVEDLPPLCRDIIKEYYKNGLSQGAIAKKRGISAQAVAARQRYGCSLLKRKMKMRRTFPERYHVSLAGAGAAAFFHSGASLVERTVERWEQLDNRAWDKNTEGESQ